MPIQGLDLEGGFQGEVWGCIRMEGTACGRALGVIRMVSHWLVVSAGRGTQVSGQAGPGHLICTLSCGLRTGWGWSGVWCGGGEGGEGGVAASAPGDILVDRLLER